MNEDDVGEGETFEKNPQEGGKVVLLQAFVLQNQDERELLFLLD